jgi:glutamate-ammonia-ligase adenylyltransferase
LKRCADPERAKHFHAQLKATLAGPSLSRLTPEQARILAALFSGSRSLSEQLFAHPDWLPVCLDSDGLRHPRRIQGLRREVEAWLNPLIAGGDSTAALSGLRVFKQRAMLRIAARDLAGLGSMSELTREISDVADVTLDGVYRVLRSQFRTRFGDPWHRNPDGVWQPTEFCILGMGKLGGQELNYSSDVDLLFVHAEEGNVFREAPARDP